MAAWTVRPVEPDVANLNRCFPKYPPTWDAKGYVYGVWLCNQCWMAKKQVLYGQYPPTFLPRVLAMFPTILPEAILHCPSGTVKGPGVTVDKVRDMNRHPQIVASADALPFADGYFDLYLADPPYSDEDAKQYGTGHFPFTGFLKEAYRVLRPGGILGILHLWVPSLSSKQWKIRGLVAVVPGYCKRTRMFTLARKRIAEPVSVELF